MVRWRSLRLQRKSSRKATWRDSCWCWGFGQTAKEICVLSECHRYIGIFIGKEKATRRGRRRGLGAGLACIFANVNSRPQKVIGIVEGLQYWHSVEVWENPTWRINLSCSVGLSGEPGEKEGIRQKDRKRGVPQETVIWPEFLFGCVKVKRRNKSSPVLRPLQRKDWSCLAYTAVAVSITYLPYFRQSSLAEWWLKRILNRPRSWIPEISLTWSPNIFMRDFRS